MIITKTPFRMSFFGGGTDMEDFFREHGGAVLSTTFDKYCYVTVRHLPRFFDYSTEISYAKTENAAGHVDKTKQKLEMLELVDEAEKVLVDKSRDLDDFGRMLDHTWKLKRQTGNAITTEGIDALYARGIEAGALGGKLLGAGGGGFLVFYVQLEKKEAVMNAMKDLLYVPFHFEDGGSRVLYYAAEDYQPRDIAQ